MVIEELAIKLLVGLIFAVLAFGGFYWLFSVVLFSKSFRYRSTMADLYIIGMIRQFAKEDGIDLEAELKELRRMEKLEKASMKSIDFAVEAEINERIQARSAKKIEEIEGKKK